MYKLNVLMIVICKIKYLFYLFSELIQSLSSNYVDPPADPDAPKFVDWNSCDTIKWTIDILNYVKGGTTFTPDYKKLIGSKNFK